MKYFKIGTITDTKIVGRKYPQLTPVSGIRDDNPLSIQKLSDDYALSQTNSIYEIEKSAKLTDIMSMGLVKYFAINEKTKDILTKFKIRDTTFIPMDIKEPSNSKWFVAYFPYTEHSVELINYDETIFYITDGLGEENHGEFKIGKDEVDKRFVWRKHYKFVGEGKVIRIKELVIKKDFQNIDLLYLSPFYMGVIVSENIKNEFETKCITGLEFQERNLRFE